MTISITVWDNNPLFFAEKFNRIGCEFFPELSKEMQELFKAESRSMFGYLIIDKRFYSFTYSTLGNDGLIVDEDNRRYSLADEFKQMIQQAIYYKLRSR